MGKYEPLARYLERLPDDSWDARFADIEQVLGFTLPNSAKQHQAWWANQDSGHSQTEDWRSAGFLTRELDLRGRRVKFVRATAGTRPGPVAKGKPEPQNDGPNADLWHKAAELSGLTDRDELEREVVEAFIRTRTAQFLAGLGGAMPDAEAPPRRHVL